MNKWEELSVPQMYMIDKKIDWRLTQKLSQSPEKLKVHFSLYVPFHLTELKVENFETFELYKQALKEETEAFDTQKFSEQKERLKILLPELPENFTGFTVMELDFSKIIELLLESTLISFMCLEKHHACTACGHYICYCEEGY